MSVLEYKCRFLNGTFRLTCTNSFPPVPLRYTGYVTKVAYSEVQWGCVKGGLGQFRSRGSTPLTPPSDGADLHKPIKKKKAMKQHLIALGN